MTKLQMLQQRLKAIGVELKGLQDKATLTEEDKTKVTALLAETETVKADIKVQESIENTLKGINDIAATPVVQQSQPAGTQVTVVKNSFEDSTGFKSPGHFMLAIRELGHGKTHEKLENAIYTRDDEGAVLVPEEISTTISKAIDGDGSLFAMTSKLKCDGNSFSHKVDNTRPWNNGITVGFAGEGTTLNKTDPTMLSDVELKLRKMYAYSEVSSESLEDAAGLNSWLQGKAGEAIVAKMNQLIISGSGVGMPQGILNSGHIHQVAAETQAAGSVVTANILKMLAARIPGGKYAWIYNPALQYHLETLVDPNGNYIFLAQGSQLNQSGYDRLRGLPMIPMMAGVKAAGTPGDIILVDLNRGYETLTKNGGEQAKFSFSPHIAFDKDKVAYKWTLRWDGKCPYTSKVQNETADANMSYIITLAARA